MTDVSHHPEISQTSDSGPLGIWVSLFAGLTIFWVVVGWAVWALT